MTKITKFIFFLIIIIGCNAYNYSLAENNYNITAKKVIYTDNNKLITASGDAVLWDDNKKKITSKKIIYNKKNQIIQTFEESKYNDEKNYIEADTFVYDLKTKTIYAQGKVVFLDNQQNKYLFDKFDYNEISKKGNGSNIKANLNDSSNFIAEKGFFNGNEETASLHNSHFTTCKKTIDSKNNYCPDWSLRSQKVKHDKKNKMLYHENVVLKIKEIPVFYSPYLSHPDPSVKRKSGFLVPVIKNISEIGGIFKAPYFWAISEDKDLTITPSYYFDEKPMLQTSFRQKFKNSFLQIENAYSQGYKNLNGTGRTPGSRNYTFLNYDSKVKDLFFKENEINFKLQKVSQSTFLKVNKINTDLFKEDVNDLENFFKLASYNDNKRIDFKVGYYDTLSVKDTSKYTYILPEVSYSMNNLKFNDFNLNFTSYFLGKKYEKDKIQAQNINNIYAEKNQIIFKKLGISTIVKGNILNNNSHNNNIIDNVNGNTSKNYYTLAVDNKLPLVKFDDKSQKTITPKIFIKYTTGQMKDSSSDIKILELSDIYSINRNNTNDKPETGLSLGHGFDFINTKQNSENRTYLKTHFGLGQVLRTTVHQNQPSTSSLDKKRSDVIGEFKIDLIGEANKFTSDDINFLQKSKNNNLKINYKFNSNESISKLYRNQIDLSGLYNTFSTKILFNEENSHVGTARSATYALNKFLTKNTFFSLDGKKNLVTNNSEYLNLSYNYENDCIKASIAFSRNYYNDQDLQNSNSLFFSIILKPFGDSFAPDISNLVK